MELKIYHEKKSLCIQNCIIFVKIDIEIYGLFYINLKKIKLFKKFTKFSKCFLYYNYFKIIDVSKVYLFCILN